MAGYCIDYSSFLEMADLPNFIQSSEQTGNALPVLQMQKHHPHLGNFNFKSFQLQHIHIMDLSWEVKEDIIVGNTNLSDTVNINFQLQGDILFEFGKLMPIHMQGGRHNLLFNPEQPGTHTVQRNKELKMFHISMEKLFFQNLIQAEEHWSEAIIKKLEKNAPFMAINHSPRITLMMLQLIKTLQKNSWEGNIRNLQVQSKLYELLALQIEQFKVPVSKPVGLKKEEIDKLQYLKQYLECHFLEELTLTGLSQLITLNEFKVKKGFKLLFDTSVFGYVKQLRMEYASRLLKDQRLTIEEVAAILGYEHAHHFSTSFKKHFGTVPSLWIK